MCSASCVAEPDWYAWCRYHVGYPCYLASFLDSHADLPHSPSPMKHLIGSSHHLVTARNRYGTDTEYPYNYRYLDVSSMSLRESRTPAGQGCMIG